MSQSCRNEARMRAIIGGVESGKAPMPPVRSHASGAAPAQGLIRQELQTARERIKELEARGTGVQLLDPKRIRHSRFRDRLDQGLSDAAFEALRRDIRLPGPDGQPIGVITPIKVRPVEGDPDHDYEVVYGHRRHRATLLEELLVPALVEQLDDAQVLQEMRRENHERSDLSVYEQSLSLARMLAEGVYPDQNSLGAGLGISVGNVSKMLALAQLPQDIIAIFRDPREISQRLGQLLRNTLKARPKVLERLKERARAEGPLSAGEVAKALNTVAGTAPKAMEGRSRSGVQIKAYPNGRGMQLIIERVLSQPQLDHLAAILEELPG